MGRDFACERRKQCDAGSPVAGGEIDIGSACSRVSHPTLSHPAEQRSRAGARFSFRYRTWITYLSILPPDTTSFSPRNPLPGGGRTPEGVRAGPEKPRGLSILRYIIPEPDHA